jgi:hypothetical protein
MILALMISLIIIFLQLALAAVVLEDAEILRIKGLLGKTLVIVFALLPILGFILFMTILLTDLENPTTVDKGFVAEIKIRKDKVLRRKPKKK